LSVAAILSGEYRDAATCGEEGADSRGTKREEVGAGVDVSAAAADSGSGGAGAAVLAGSKAALISAGKTALAERVGEGTAGVGAFLVAGAVINPLLEVLYQAPQFRSFQYDFLFYPRDEREAVEVQKIIASLQYHQAPEFDQGSAGSLLIPPSEFDIEFYYAGKINKNMVKKFKAAVPLSKQVRQRHRWSKKLNLTK
jgi:hypothetical protein